MNLFPKKLCLILLSAAVVFTGCTKKPVRPEPGSTIGTADNSLKATPVDATPLTDPTATGLEARPPGVIEDADTIRGLLQPVLFDLDKSNIKESERAKVAEAQKYIVAHPQYRLLFEGHCDWRGTSEYNLGLGDRRATAVKKYAEKIGVPAAKSETLSKGNQGAVEKGTEEQMASDRRVDIVILKK